MYRTNDPRFRRRLNEIGQTLENANETAQSSIYIFGQNYVKPCFESVGSCLTTCVDASCPSLNLRQRDRLRRQRGRSVGRAELSFDFYDDWDEDENDGLLGWGNDEFDRLVGAGGNGYGTVVTNAQPGRQRGMNYQQKGNRRKSTVIPQEAGTDPSASGTSFLTRLFGGKTVKYKPSVADLQVHPGARKMARDITEGEALLEELDEDTGEGRRKRTRSGTASSADTGGSFSSRGDLFPSDDETDAIPLDDEFAMVLERRTTGSGPETDYSSGRSQSANKRGKRPSAGSRTSTRRTFSSRSSISTARSRSRTASGAGMTNIEPVRDITQGDIPSLNELKLEEHDLEREEEAEVERRRQEARKLALERGLDTIAADTAKHDDLPSKEATPQSSGTPTSIPAEPRAPSVEMSQLEEEGEDAHEAGNAKLPR